MSLPWSGQQIEWLQAMGLDVLRRPADDRAIEPTPAGDDAAGRSDALPEGLMRAARGVDLAPLVASAGIPRDIASRRAFWRLLRPLRKAARRG